jgi:alginate O-acetyltransferase complex protein AlgI
MVFNSFSYLVFIVATVAAFFSTPQRFRWVVVLLASYFFYMSWRPIYGLLLLGTTLADWSLALVMGRSADPGARRTILTISVVMNLAVLAVFKYFTFLSTTVWSLLELKGSPLIIRLALPIGISFYTFQSLAYMIDVYRGRLLPERNFGRYAAFVAFFPHLVSGPILRPAHIIPQLHEDKMWSWQNLDQGLFLIATGLIKKVVIADRLGPIVEKAYDAPTGLSGATLLMATYLFAIQIYCDFAGYTDIAIGSARILGYQIPDNFRQPYFSATIQEFWRRWHISLSTWLRDYLYIPLGGNRKGSVRTYVNLMITMLLGGLWHGPAWTFVAWGLLQGLLLSLSRLTLDWRDRLWARVGAPAFLVSIVRIAVTFNLVAASWVVFRARTIAEAIRIFRTIALDFGGFQPALFSRDDLTFAVYAVVALLLFDLLQTRQLVSRWVSSLSWTRQVALAYLAVLVLIAFGVQNGPQFIYFQF